MDFDFSRHPVMAVIAKECLHPNAQDAQDDRPTSFKTETEQDWPQGQQAQQEMLLNAQGQEGMRSQSAMLSKEAWDSAKTRTATTQDAFIHSIRREIMAEAKQTQDKDKTLEKKRERETLLNEEQEMMTVHPEQGMSETTLCEAMSTTTKQTQGDIVVQDEREFDNHVIKVLEACEENLGVHQFELFRRACRGLNDMQGIEQMLFLVSRAEQVVGSRAKAHEPGSEQDEAVFDFINNCGRTFSFTEASIIRTILLGADRESLAQVRFMLGFLSKQLKKQKA